MILSKFCRVLLGYIRYDGYEVKTRTITVGIIKSLERLSICAE